MRYAMTIKRAKDLEAEVYVLTPQHPTGLLLVHTVEGIEVTDDSKWIEITTEDGRKHVVSPDDRLLILFESTTYPGPVVWLAIKFERSWFLSVTGALCLRSCQANIGHS